MDIVARNDLWFELPSWLVWIEWDSDNFFVKPWEWEVKQVVSCYCERVSLIVFLNVFDSWKIELDCNTRLKNWNCISTNWPRDEEGRHTKCLVDFND